MPAYIFWRVTSQLKLQGLQSIQMHRDITRLRSLGVGENFFRTGRLTPEIARGLWGACFICVKDTSDKPSCVLYLLSFFAKRSGTSPGRLATGTLALA